MADPDTELDVLVIGGGVVGCGIALDAVTRGLSVGLVERRDLASGTSSRSSKLIHGGVRYLEMLDFGLVHEALQERGLLLQRLAPHLVKPVSFLYPLKHRAWERIYTGAGLALYDALAMSIGSPGSGAAGRTGLPRHRHLSRKAALRLAPGLRKDAMVGAVRYYDAQVDDARFVTELARTAAGFGARIAPRVRVTGFIRQGERVTGAECRDEQSGEAFSIRAHQVVNATGVWTDDTQALVGDREHAQFHVRASKGVHLVVPRDRIQSTSGIILRTATSVLFMIPWGRHWIIGTTDTDWRQDLSHPAATSRDIDYLIDQCNTVLATPLVRADVEGVYAGLRPLLAGESDSTSRLSREHIVAHPVPGLVVVAGGKYTTYRVMAKDAVDAVADALPARVPASVSDRTPLLGAAGYEAMWNARSRLAAASGLHVARIEHLLNRYGTMTEQVLASIAADPTLAEPLPGAPDYLAAEISYAASHEGALHLDDALARRTRISIEAWDRGVEAARSAAELMAVVLGWTPEQIDHEVAVYLRRVEAERASQEQPTDELADRVRTQAPDVVSG